MDNCSRRIVFSFPYPLGILNRMWHPDVCTRGHRINFLCVFLPSQFRSYPMLYWHNKLNEITRRWEINVGMCFIRIGSINFVDRSEKKINNNMEPGILVAVIHKITIWISLGSVLWHHLLEMCRR